MKKQGQNVRSTRIKMENENTDPPTREKKMHDVYIKIHNASNTMHSDQTGCFPATSSSSNQYIMVLVEVDENYIDAEPMKNRSAGSMVKAYLTLWKQIIESGSIKPMTHILDNEASVELKEAIKKNCTIQLVPPDNHRRNLAERAIQTFKNHFKAILAGVDNSFPMRLWDKLLPQTVLTFNLLRQSKIAPTVSAYQYIQGSFDYNKMTLAPMGCAVQLHESCERQGTWAENTTDGWYLQTSPEHYRCHKIHVKKTNSERVSDSVFFKHKNITQPTLSMADLLKKAINNLAHALKGRRNTNRIKEMEALQKLDKLLNKTPEATTPRVTNPVDKPTPRVASQSNAPTPRVASQSNAPTPRVEATAPFAKTKEIPPEQAKMRQLIRAAINNRARIPQRHQMNLRQSQRIEWAQLIHDKETGEFLNYRKLLRDQDTKKHERDQLQTNSDD